LLNSPRNSLFAPFEPVQVSCQKNKFLRATTALRPPGLVSCRLVFWPFVHDFTKFDLWGETRRFCHRGRKVKGSKSRRVQELKRARQVWRGDKMRWVLSIMSWSAMQVRSRQLAADRGAVTVLAEASGWYLSRVAKERNPGAPGRSGLREGISILYICSRFKRKSRPLYNFFKTAHSG